MDDYAKQELIKNDIYQTQNAFLPNQKNNDIINYLFDVQQLLEDVFNILANNTLYDPEHDTYLRAEEDEPLISDKDLLAIKLTLRIVSDPKMQTSTILQDTSETISAGAVKRIQYVLLASPEFKKLNPQLRDLVLYDFQILIQLLLNKNVDWTLLEKIMTIKTINQHEMKVQSKKQGLFSKKTEENNQ